MNKSLRKSTYPKYPDHYKKNPILDSFRNIVFGIEDGMVSTFGVITGIALVSYD